MVTTRKERVVFIGAGNLATHLATALHGAGYDIVQIFSRTDTSARQRSARLGPATGRTYRVFTDHHPHRRGVSRCRHLHILGERRRAGRTHRPCTGARRGHSTCTRRGSIPLSVFSTVCRRYGVFYPLQTFSKNRAVTFAEIPLFIEGSSPEVTATLREMGERISRQGHRSHIGTTPPSPPGSRLRLATLPTISTP